MRGPNRCPVLIFRSQPWEHLSYGLVFMPSPVWVNRVGMLINLNPSSPKYQLGSVKKLLDKEIALLTDFPELVLEELSVGVNSSVLALDSPVSSGDRVEVYRPLLVDPKEARRKRAKKK